MEIYQGKHISNRNAPQELNGKHLVFEEIFRSGFPKPTINKAENVLAAIRGQHSKPSGWLEIDAWIEKWPQGYVAVRHHAQYK